MKQQLEEAMTATSPAEMSPDDSQLQRQSAAPELAQLSNGEEELLRGGTINFYAIQDPMILAAWASFFRDQYTRFKKELDVRDFLRTVETEIVPSLAIKEIFRILPFSDEPKVRGVPINVWCWTNVCLKVRCLERR